MKLNSAFLISLILATALASIEPIPPALPDLPDWNIVHNLILSKNIAELEKITDQVIAGPWSCYEKFTFLHCMVGKIYFFNKAAIDDLPSEQNQTLKVTQIQKWLTENRQKAKRSRIKIEKSRKILRDFKERDNILEKQKNKKYDPKDSRRAFKIINKYAKPRLTLVDQKKWEEEENRFLIEIRKVEMRKQRIKKNQEEIKEKEKENMELMKDKNKNDEKQKKEKANSDLIKKRKQENEMEMKEILLIQENVRKNDNRPNLNDQLRTKIETIFKEIQIEEKNKIAKETQDIKAIKYRLRQFIKSLGAIDNALPLIKKIEESQFSCYQISALVSVSGNNIISTLDDSSLSTFVNETLGYAGLIFLQPYVQEENQLQLLNVLSEDWESKYKSALSELIADPQCCNLDNSFVKIGVIDKIQSSFLFVIPDGETAVMKLRITACSKIYLLDSDYNKIAFLAAGQYDDFSIIKAFAVKS